MNWAFMGQGILYFSIMLIRHQVDKWDVHKQIQEYGKQRHLLLCNKHTKDHPNIGQSKHYSHKAQSIRSKNNCNQVFLRWPGKVIYCGVLTTVRVRSIRDLKPFGQQVLLTICLYFNLRRKSFFSKNVHHLENIFWKK